MPINFDFNVTPKSKDAFHAIDYQVMKHAFEVHNDLGRFCDEVIYQAELTRRCRTGKLTTNREFGIRLTHGDFVKEYFADLVVESGAVYELKAVSQLNARHENQLLNYLLVIGLQHGKLINFGSGSVESRYVSTTLRPEVRLKFNINDEEFNVSDSDAEEFKSTLERLFKDWGVFLDVGLYRETMLHLAGGSTAPTRIKIFADGQVVGHQNMLLLNAESAWHISAIKKQMQGYESHLRRLLKHTQLKNMHWFNMSNHQVTAKSLKN